MKKISIYAIERHTDFAQNIEAPKNIADAGFDGTLLSWPKYIEGMEEFRDVTYPLVKQAGLRD